MCISHIPLSVRVNVDISQVYQVFFFFSASSCILTLVLDIVVSKSSTPRADWAQAQQEALLFSFVSFFICALNVRTPWKCFLEYKPVKLREEYTGMGNKEMHLEASCCKLSAESCADSVQPTLLPIFKTTIPKTSFLTIVRTNKVEHLWLRLLYPCLFF